MSDKLKINNNLAPSLLESNRLFSTIFKYLPQNSQDGASNRPVRLFNVFLNIYLSIYLLFLFLTLSFYLLFLSFAENSQKFFRSWLRNIFLYFLQPP